VKATVNGEARILDLGTTVGRLLRELGVREGGIAVAVNDRVVRKSAFDDVALQDGDAVEIIRAVAGG
jgi:thiamine biosynthesis protein ThiS